MATVTTPPNSLNEAEKRAIINSYKALIKDSMDFTSKEERKLIRKAFDYSMEAHGDARRKSGEPYILHPVAVARILVKDMGLSDVTSIICALLHDVVEDTFAELTDIQREFGEQTMKIIDGLTKISGVMDANVSKQAESFRKMLVTMSDDIRVALVKIADRLHNMRTLEHTKRETQLKIASETQYLYAPLAHRLGLYTIKTELEDLAMQYTEAEEYKMVSDKLRDTKMQRSKYMQAFIRPIHDKLKRLGVPFEIKGRVKGVRSISEKMRRQGIPFEEIYDIFAIRIILDSKPEEEKVDCWRAYSAICSTYRPHPERTRDWISMPRSSGYESLHVTVMGPGGRWVEVQIRTSRMDYMAEKGVAAHWRYKGQEGSSEKERERALEKWLNTIRDLLENKQLSALDVVSEFKSNLVSDEIYVFTPKGDMKVLPAGATALDFAYEIHTSLGHSCIGAKVNHQVVPLSYELHNGDQVEVLTSKKQLPKPEWLAFVKTSRAINRIKEELKEQRKATIAKGKRIFDWKIRQLGISAEHALVHEMLHAFRIPDHQELYFRLGAHRIDVKKVLEFIESKRKALLEMASPNPDAASSPGQSFEEFVQQTLGVQTDSLLMGNNGATGKYKIARCCHPIPGDMIVGLANPNKDEIIVHRTNCEVAVEQMSSFGQRIVKAKWTDYNDVEFLAGFKIIGQDKMGMLNAIVRSISLQMKRNIRSFTIDTEDGMFEGTVRVYIHNTEEAEQIIDLLAKINGVFSVSRMDS